MRACAFNMRYKLQLVAYGKPFVKVIYPKT